MEIALILIIVIQMMVIGIMIDPKENTTREDNDKN